MLEPNLIAALFGAMREEFAIDPNAEITVECAPGQIADETLDALVEAGVNRVSLGVQSFIDREAQVSGRLHSRSVVLERPWPAARCGDHQSECGFDCGTGGADCCIVAGIAFCIGGLGSAPCQCVHA